MVHVPDAGSLCTSGTAHGQPALDGERDLGLGGLGVPPRRRHRGDADTPIEHADASAQSTTTATNATEARRLNLTSISITNLDGVAAGDLVVLVVYRDAANGSDTLAVDAEFIGATLEFA